MKSRSEWLGIPVHALGALFIARWLAIAGFSISMLVFGVYCIAMLGQRFNLITGGEYRRIVRPDHSESAKLKQMNTLIVEQKGTISMLQEEVDNINSMLEFEKAMRGKLEKKLEEQAKTIGKLNSDIDRLESEKSKLKAMADVAKADLKLAEAKIKAEQSTRIQAERELKRALAKIKVTEKDSKAAQSALAGATSRVQRLDDRILELEAILADPRDGSTDLLHKFIRSYWRDFGSRRFDRVRAAWLKPNVNELRALIMNIEWVKVKKVAAKPPSPDKNGGITSAAYVCITSKNQGQSEDDWAGSMRLSKGLSGWKIERMNINKGPCY